jgi:glycosyltransferase involved in cell wall biosynthesis
MQGILDLRAAPQAEWDAIICTSKAVHASILHNMNEADAHLLQRFGRVPARPQLPVIPLGITCDDFSADPAAGADLRKRMGWGAGDIVITTLSRLLPYGKFDPGPLFIALREAQARLPDHRLHFLACGIYGDGHSQAIFESCARTLMPGISYTHLDGADATARRETLSGADIFAFPIDNIQETFGLAPIEAMAAGLPVLTSDWDGMRDTVSDDVGIRIPTATGSGRHTMLEAWQYQVGRTSYAQYGSNTSSLTALDMRTMIEAIVTLASDEGLRQSMGKAGQTRARALFDWSVIIPRMQDLWSELAAIRAHHKAPPRGPVPMAVSPMDLFSAYPSRQIAPGEGRFFARPGSDSVAEIFTARRFDKLGQPFEPEERVSRVHAALTEAGANGATSNDLARVTSLPVIRVERACLFLMKYGLADHEPA